MEARLAQEQWKGSSAPRQSGGGQKTHRKGEKSRSPARALTAQPPGLPQSWWGRGPQRSAPENHLRDNETLCRATVQATAGGEADGRLRPRPPSPEKLQKRHLGAGPGNGSAVLRKATFWSWPWTAVLCWSSYKLTLWKRYLKAGLGLEFI